MQVADIDVKKQSPVGHGRVICFSVYGGQDLHLAKEPPIDGVLKTQLWVDTYRNGEEDVSPSCSPTPTCQQDWASVCSYTPNDENSVN